MPRSQKHLTRQSLQFHVCPSLFIVSRKPVHILTSSSAHSTTLSYCFSHSQKQLTGLSPAHDARPINSTKLVSHFKPLLFFPSPAANLYPNPSLPLHTLGLSARRPSHTHKQLTSHQSAHDAHTKNSIKQISHFKFTSLRLFPLPASRLYTYLALSLCTLRSSYTAPTIT